MKGNPEDFGRAACHGLFLGNLQELGSAGPASADLGPSNGRLDNTPPGQTGQSTLM